MEPSPSSGDLMSAQQINQEFTCDCKSSKLPGQAIGECPCRFKKENRVSSKVNIPKMNPSESVADFGIKVTVNVEGGAFGTQKKKGE